MAFLKDFESPSTGLVVKDAYHVIGDVKLSKRTNSINVAENSNDPLGGSPGYIGLISIHVFSSKEARDSGMQPVFYINSAMPEHSSLNLKFTYDPESTDDILTQGYNYLSTSDYYKDSVKT